jgi:hypothetical protein
MCENRQNWKRIEINNRCQLPSIKQNKNKKFLFSTNRNTELCQNMNNNLAEKPKQQNSKIWKKNSEEIHLFHLCYSICVDVLHVWKMRLTEITDISSLSATDFKVAKYIFLTGNLNLKIKIYNMHLMLSKVFSNSTCPRWGIDWKQEIE